MNNKITKMLVTMFVLFSVITVSIIGYLRMNIERKNDSVEIIMEYSELKKLAAQSDLSVIQWMTELGEVGLHSVAIMEETLLRYISECGITYHVTSMLTSNGAWEERYPEEVVNYIEQGNEFSLLIEPNLEEEYNNIIEGLSHYHNIEFWHTEIDGSYYIFVDQDEEDLLYATTDDIYNAAGRLVGTNKDIYGTEVLNVPIGFDKEKIEEIKQSGLELVLRPVNYFNEPMSAWVLYESEIEKYGTGSGLLFFDGEGVVGYGSENDKYVAAIQDFVDEKSMNIVILETIEQRQYFNTKGIQPVIDNLSNDYLVRAFNIWDFIAKRYQYNAYYTGGEEIGNSIYRAVTERNIRAIYFRPFIQFNGSYVTKLEDYKNMFSDLEVRLAKHGYMYGNATTFNAFSLPVSVKMLLTLEVAIFGLVLLNMIFGILKMKLNILYVVLAILGSIGAHYIAPNMAVKLSALASAIIFSTMSVVYFTKKYLLDNERKGIFNAIKGLILSSLISIFGALYIGSIMADTKYFLEIELFTGVKASLLLPIAATILAVAIFYIKENAKLKGKHFIIEFIESFKNFLNMSIKIKYGLILLVIAAVGYVYLARSGNESNLEPMTIEIMLRNFLEEVLLARPRTKEFMLAFPAMVVGAYYASLPYLKKEMILKYIYTLAFAVFAIVGQSSITNTFSHIRTPLYLSLVRTGYSIGFGLTIGLVIIVLLKLLGILYRKVMDTELFKALKA